MCCFFVSFLRFKKRTNKKVHTQKFPKFRTIVKCFFFVFGTNNVTEISQKGKHKFQFYKLSYTKRMEIRVRRQTNKQTNIQTKIIKKV